MTLLFPTPLDEWAALWRDRVAGQAWAVDGRAALWPHWAGRAAEGVGMVLVQSQGEQATGNVGAES